MPSPAPEAVATSTSRISSRPVKRRALTPVSQQASQVEALFAKPEQAINTDAPSSKSRLAPPPEIVANVQGSSAGAGSGEFHVYKASRRREYERLRVMDEELIKEKADREFAEKQDEKKTRDEAKTAKNKARRDKRKKNKGKGEGTNGDADGKSGKPARLKTLPLPSQDQDTDDGALDDGGEVKSAEEIGITIHDED